MQPKFVVLLLSWEHQNILSRVSILKTDKRMTPEIWNHPLLGQKQ